MAQGLSQGSEMEPVARGLLHTPLLQALNEHLLYAWTNKTREATVLTKLGV